MEAIPSDRAHEEKERFLIERKNGRHVVVLSVDDYNEMLKMIYARKNVVSDASGTGNK